MKLKTYISNNKKKKTPLEKVKDRLFPERNCYSVQGINDIVRLKR